LNRIMKQAKPESEGMSVADYKRMVSYMYQYENGVKKKNVGFTRVEAKDGQCKITLHMQLLGQLDSIFPTYILQRKHSDLELIYLGDTVLKNQVMDSKLVTDEKNVMGSGYPLSDMGGLLLFLNENVFFATEWDDKPILANEVLEALKPKKDRESKLTLEEELQIPKYKLPRGYKTIERLQKPASQLAGTGRVTSPIEAASVRSVGVDHSRENRVNVSSLKESTVDNSSQKKVSQEEHLTKASIPEKQGNSLQEKNLKEVALQEATFQKASAREATLQGTALQETVLREDILQGKALQEAILQEATDSMEKSNRGSTCEAEELKKESIEETTQEMADPQVATRIFEKHPRIYPFEDNEILICAKIEPKDIGLLPKELWALSNNSFLIHGYYCYHHLIFAKMKNRSGCQYILGVPGIYHNREKFMAKMFGFEGFKPIRKRELRQGDFGYWYTPVCF
jgi:hypothetical protein